MNTSANSSWFYAENGDRKGPVTFAALETLLQQGLPNSSLVWTEGMAEWIPASSVPQLNGAPSPSSNPYEAPASGEQPSGSTYTGGELVIPTQPIPLDIGFCISQGWKFTLANFGTIFLLGLCYFAISIVVSLILTTIGTAIDGPPTITYYEGMPIRESGGIATSLLSLVNTVFSVFLSLGSFHYGFRLLKGETPPISDLFSQGSKLLSAIGAYILFSILVTIGLILLIIPGIIIALRCGFFMQVIVDKNLGPVDALKYSWNLTKGNGLSIFGFWILSFIIVIAGTLALLVGLLWALPTVWLASIIAFRYLHQGRACIKVLP